MRCTEEIWQGLGEAGPSIMVQAIPSKPFGSMPALKNR